MIKFSCPHCNRVINVKDEMAGKRGRCTGCKEPITVPSAPPKTKPTGRSADDLEALAASLLAEPKKEEAKSTTTVDFTCPQCDAELHLPADLAGRQAPCPECRRIIKVPQLVKTGPRDWKRPDEQTGPTGAKREDVALDGAWGTETSRGGVSRGALVEAKVIKEVREPITLKQWIGYGAALATFLIFGGVGLFWFLGARKENLELGGVKPAEALLASLAASGAPEPLATLNALVGEYHQRAQTYDKAKDRFVAPLYLREARKNLALIEDDLQRQAVARRLLHLNVRLGLGEEELGEILTVMPPGSLRNVALREATRAALAETSADKIEEKVGMLRQAVQRGMGGGQDASELLNGIGIIGQEAVRAGHFATAQRLADSLRTAYKADQPYPAHFGALLIMARKPELEGARDRQLADLGQVEALARQGNVAAAVDLIGKQFTTPTQVHLEAELILAEAMIEKEQRDQAAARVQQEVLAILERYPGGMPWQRLRTVELLLAAGKIADAEQLTPKILSGTLLPHGALAILEAKLGQATQASPELANGLKEDANAYNLAVYAVARHNARADARGTMTWAERLDKEDARAFATVGATLGMQDAAQRR